MKKAVIVSTVFFILTGAVFAQPEAQELKIFTIKHGEAQAMYSVVEHLKSGQGKMSVDPNTNSLIVVDYTVNLERIAEVIERLDAAQKQVEIKVVIADVTDIFLEEAGLATGRVIIPTGDFSAVLNSINTSDSSNIRSEMTVRTVSNQPATIQASVEEIFGYALTRHGEDWETLSPITRQAGEMLEVLPRVNNDGTILVTLSPSSSAFQEDGTISEKSILTQVVINDGDTIAIGGVDTAGQETGSSTPMFSRRAKEHKSVVMFLTAVVSE